MTGPYRYPDAGDAIFETYRCSEEPYPGYWARADGLALAIARRAFSRTGRRHLLDFGCGRGRLLGTFAGDFQAVTAVDPDPARAADARALGIPGLEVLTGGAELLAAMPARFDAALCSHVIQHVPAAEAAHIVAALAWALEPGGVLVLLTSRACGPTRQVATRRLAATTAARPLPAAEFDALAAGTPAGGELPVRLFADGDIRRLLAPHFDISREWAFADMSPARALDRIVLRDRLINLAPARARRGSNLLVVARRSGRASRPASAA